MPSNIRLSWLCIAVLAGVSYGFIGIVFAFPSAHARLWRLAAWIVSGVVYAAHLAYERYQFRNGPFTMALHATVAVALGAFLLAAGALTHAVLASSHAPYWRFCIALGAWPIITAVPAFLVALVIAFILTRLQPIR